MAFNAPHLLMRPASVRDLLNRIRMAAAAQPCRRRTCKFDGGRPVRLMAPEAILERHPIGMRIMAFPACGRFPVSRMTFLAIHPGMLTGIPVHIRFRSRMTGNACRFDRIDPGQIHFHRIMGIMAGNAIFYGIMRMFCRFMATATGSNRIFPPGRMLLVTVQTTHLCFVEPAAFIHVPDLLQMALDTIFIRQRISVAGKG